MHSVNSLSIIIPALNEEHTLGVTLKALSQQQPHPQLGPLPSVQVIVVDNGSTDRTALIAAGFPVQVVSALPSNRSIARNAGAAVSTGELLFFMDAGVTFGLHYISVLMETFRQLPDSTCAMQVPLAFGTYQTMKSKVDSECLAVPLELPIHLRTEYLDTKACIIKRSAFIAAGGFDVLLPRTEDIDLGWRLGLLGVPFAAVSSDCFARFEDQLICFYQPPQFLLLSIARGVDTASALLILHKKWKSVHQLRLRQILQLFIDVGQRKVGRLGAAASFIERLCILVDGAVTFVCYVLGIASESIKN